MASLLRVLSSRNVYDPSSDHFWELDILESIELKADTAVFHLLI